MTEYVKIIGSIDDASKVAFYINKDYVELAKNHPSKYALLRFAEIAIDLNTNELIKCRYLLDEIFDNILLTTPSHCDTILNNL